MAIGLVGTIALIVVAMVAARGVPDPPPSDTAAQTAFASPPAAAPEPEDRTLAFAAAAAFCRPDVDSGTWQRALGPFLTTDARTLYAATAPANVPCSGVKDAGGPVGDQQTSTDAAWQFTADVGGPVTVTLHRDAPAAPWKVSYIDPASGAP